MKRGVGFLGVLLLWIAGPAGAQDTSPVAARLAQIWLQPANLVSHVAFADALEDYCGEISNVLPRNTPREDQWVRAEIQSGNEARIDRALASDEHNRQVLVRTFEDCIAQAALLRHALSRGDRIASGRGWIQLSLVFNADLVLAGRRSGLITTQSDRFNLHFAGAMQRSFLEAALRSLEGLR